MRSHIIGQVDWDPVLLRQDIDTIESFPRSPGYDDYSVGSWGSHSLWNRTGRASDAGDHPGVPRPARS